MMPKNATTNAVMYPEYWEVPPQTYLEIVALLVKNCPKWRDYYRSELEEIMPLVKAYEKGRKKIIK